MGADPFEIFMGYPGIIFAGIWGAMWGSFYNVLIVRLPADESIVSPASHCRACGKTIRWYENIPIFSYLALQGRCPNCGETFSIRYLMVEIVVCLLTIGIYYKFVIASENSFAISIGLWLILSFFCGILTAITVIDLDTLRIPNRITYPGIPLAIILSVFLRLPNLWDGLIGAIAGYALIGSISWTYKKVAKREGMGMGDAKLLALIAGLLGWQVIFPVLFLASCQGTIVGIPLLLLQRTHKLSPSLKNNDDSVENNDQPETLRYAMIPFGPFLSLAAIEVIFLRDQIAMFIPFFN